MIDGYQVTDRLLEQLPIGVLVLDGDGNLRASNSTAFRLMDVAVEDLLLNRLDKAVKNPDAQTALGMVMAHDMEKSEFCTTSAGRTVKWTVERAAKATGETIIVLEDVTEFRRMEIIQREFLNVILHKLRGPLSTLKTSLSLLQSDTDGRLTGSMAEVLDMGCHEASRLNMLLNDLRNLFHIDAGLVEKDLEFETFSIAVLFKKVAAEISRLPDPFSDAGVRLNPTGELGACVHADFDKLRQALGAFVKNAVMFSPAGTSVGMNVKSVDGSVIIEIRDRGIGVAGDKTGLLFTKFFREDNELTRTHEGNGLGLYIARAFIQHMNGTVSIDTQKDHGTTVTIMLPAV